MNLTTVSLKQQFADWAGPSSLDVIHITFQGTRDFAPHGEHFLGELPMLYSFSKEYQKYSGQVEIKDGHFSLLPLLLKEQSIQKLVLPDFAGYFYPEFLTTTLAYDFVHEHRDTCYVLLDYYQDLTTPQFIEQSYARIKQLTQKYDKVQIVFNLHALSSKLPNFSHHLLQGARELPENCHFISNNELFLNKDFQGRSVYIFTDPDFVMKSPWENIFASRGAIINGMSSELPKSIVSRIPLGKGVEKLIYRKQSSFQPLPLELKEYLKGITSMLRSESDLLNLNYLRLMRDAVRLIKEHAHHAEA